MNIREIKKPITAAMLNESLAQKYGTKINIDAFTLEQLEDARNKLRTQLRDIETNESFNAVQSESYQKSKLFLDVLTQAISEAEKKKTMVKGPDGKMVPDYAADGKGKKDLKKKKTDESIVSEDEASPEERLKALSDLYNVVMDNIKRTEEIMYMTPPGMNRDQYEQEIAQMQKRAAGIKKDAQALKAGMQGADDIRANAQAKESIIREGEEDKAELVMAAKDMVDRVTGWMEDTAEMQSESMLELADAIRDEMGSEASETFTSTVKPGLEAMYTAMEATRASLTQGVGQLTGEAEPADMMGAEEPEADMEPTVDAEVDVDAEAGAEAEDDFAADPAAAGGEEEAGRETRESIERSRKLGTILSKKK